MGKETGRAARRAGLATQWSQEKKEAVVKAKKQQENKSKKRAAPQDDEEEWETDEDDKKNTQAKKARKAAVGPEQSESEEEDDDSEEDDSDFGVDLSRLDDESDSDSESEIEADEIEEKKPAAAAATAGGDKMEVDEDEEEDDDEEEEIDVDELSVDGEDEETVAATSRVRETINNKEGLLAALRRFQLDTTPGSVPFAMHQCVVSKKVTADAIESVDDDLARELAFMNQSLEAARTARTLLKKEGVPFTRPTDYFAEMIRTDETMEKVKAKMIEDATAKKASAEAKKQRDLKKFGKQVQVAKQQERAKQKREVLNKIDLLKKKRADGSSGALGATEADDLFDVAVDNELGNKSAGKKRSFGGESGGKNAKRQKKDSKYGHGGKKRHMKSGDAMSSGDLSGFSAKRMKTGNNGGRTGKPGGGPKGSAPRLGKARRKAAAGKR